MTQSPDATAIHRTAAVHHLGGFFCYSFWQLPIMERDLSPYCAKVEEYWLTKDRRMLRTCSSK